MNIKDNDGNKSITAVLSNKTNQPKHFCVSDVDQSLIERTITESALYRVNVYAWLVSA